MFEFESKGNMNDLQNMQKDLLDHLGFEKTDGEYPEGDYLDVKSMALKNLIMIMNYS